MNKIILLIVAIIATFIIIAAFNENNITDEESAIVTVTDIQHINDALKKGPVLIEIGTDRCPACIAQKPILKNIANEYENKATVMYLNADRTRALAASFNVYSIPDMFVIVYIENGDYIYMSPAGELTKNRNEARYIGLTGKRALEDTLNAAIDYRSLPVDNNA